MSIRLMSQVWAYEFDHGQQAVMLALADHANDDGEDCFPSVPLLAWKTGYSERQVTRILQSLVSAYVLIVVAPATNRRPTEYAIRLNKAKPKPTRPPARGDMVTPPSAVRGDAVSPQPPARGDMVTPLEAVGGDMVSPQVNSWGDICDARGDICDARGDIAMSPEPSLEPPIESSSSTRAHARGQPETATADDDDEAVTRVLATELQRAGVAYSPLLFERYADLAKEIGAPAVVLGVQAATLQGKQHVFNYVKRCAVSAAQGNSSLNGKPVPIETLDFKADW